MAEAEGGDMFCLLSAEQQNLLSLYSNLKQFSTKFLVKAI